MIQDHVRQKIRPTENFDLDTVQYSNERVGTMVKTLREAVDWLFANLYTQYVGTVDTPADLPVSANANDYVYVNDDGDGKSAGYIYIVLDGVASWQKKYDVDYSVDGLLTDLVNQTKPLYVFLNGRTGGQSIFGGVDASDALDLHGSSHVDKTQINFHDDFIPSEDNERTIGSVTNRLKDLLIAGSLKDGSISLTLANLKLAFDHVSLKNNPHEVGYDQLINKLETLTLGGGLSGSINLNSSGNKTLTATVIDDSHNHTTSKITDFDDAVYERAKTLILDNDIVTYAYDDANKTIKPTINTHTTNKLSDIDSPTTANKIVASTGTKYTEKSLNVEITGETSGSGSYDGTTEKVEITTSVDSVKLEKINEINFKNITTVISTGAGTVNVQAVGHQLKTNNKVHLVSSETTPTLDGEYTITVVDVDNFTITETVTTGGNGYYIPDNAQFLYDTTTKKFITRREFSEISLSELNDLDEDVLTQYFNRNGRTGGQTAIGGVDTGEHLILESTSHATKGEIRFKDNLTPDADASYSGGWNGTNLGSPTNRLNNIYIAGEIKGFRLPTVSANPSPSTQTKGAVVWNEVDEKAYVDTGVEYKLLSGSNPPAMLETFASVETKTVDMSSIVEDVNEWNWVLLNDSTNEVFHGAKIEQGATVTELVINVDFPLNGTYKIKAY